MNGLTIEPGEILSGSGTIQTSALFNNGEIAIRADGSAPLKIVGDYLQSGNGALVFEIGGPSGGGGGNLLEVTGVGELFGHVVFRFTDGYAPSAGDEFNFALSVGEVSSNSQVVYDVENLLPGFEFDAGFDLDTGTLTLQANNDATYVPEPSQLVMLAGLAGAAAVLYWLRRRAEKKP